jgi:hypothetical protein
MAERPAVDYRADKVNDFRPHSDGTGSFSAFAVSPQLRKPLVSAAFEVIAIAKAIAPRGPGRPGHRPYADSFAVNKARATYLKPKRGPRQGRAVATVINDADNAVPMEFGSGDPSVGLSAGADRPQGGWNKPYRVLGKAGGRVGDWHE